MDNRLNATTKGIWKGMRARCNSRARKEYANYGGRGIRVCIVGQAKMGLSTSLRIWERSQRI